MKSLLAIILLCAVAMAASAQTTEMQIFGDAPAMPESASLQVTVDNALRHHGQAVTDAVHAQGKLISIDVVQEVVSRGFTENTVRQTVVLGAQYTRADNMVHAVHNLPLKDRQFSHGFGWWWMGGMACMILSMAIMWRAPAPLPLGGMGACISSSVVIAHISYLAAIIASFTAVFTSNIATGVILSCSIAAIVITTVAVVNTTDKDLRLKRLKVSNSLYTIAMIISLPVFFYL